VKEESTVGWQQQGITLKNQAPDFFHISRVSEHILHRDMGSFWVDMVSIPHF